jgi:hypothetical protein
MGGGRNSFDKSQLNHVQISFFYRRDVTGSKSDRGSIIYSARFCFEGISLRQAEVLVETKNLRKVYFKKNLNLFYFLKNKEEIKMNKPTTQERLVSVFWVNIKHENEVLNRFASHK